MSKRMLRIITIFAIIFYIIISLYNISMADVTMDDAYSMVGKKGSSISNVENFMSKLAGFIQVIASAVATIMLIGIAIKYIISSPGEKAELKNHIVVYVIGIALLYSSTAIIGIIRKFF